MRPGRLAVRGAGEDRRAGLPQPGRLETGVDGLRRVADDLLAAGPATHQRLLVAIDQAQELFTRTTSDARRRFAELLRDAVTSPAWVLAAMRSEFLDTAPRPPATPRCGYSSAGSNPASPTGAAATTRRPSSWNPPYRTLPAEPPCWGWPASSLGFIPPAVNPVRLARHWCLSRPRPPRALDEPGIFSFSAGTAAYYASEGRYPLSHTVEGATRCPSPVSSPWMRR